MPLQPNDLFLVQRGTDLFKTEYQSIEGGAPVNISGTAPADPDEGDLWWADTDEDEGGGRLYVWTGDEWVDTSMPGGGALTESIADGRYLSRLYQDSAHGNLTFNGTTDFKKRVRVDETTSPYFLALSGDIPGTYNVSGNATALEITSNFPEVTKDEALACGIKTTVGSDEDINLLSVYQARLVSEKPFNNIKEVRGFDCSGITFSTRTEASYGFYGNLPKIPNTWNVYCNGFAPNLMKGGVQFEETNSTDSLTLDEYEEGIYTPVITQGTPEAFTQAPKEIKGRYTKIGNLVHCNITITFDPNVALVDKGKFEINLPFDVVTGHNYSGVGVAATGTTNKYSIPFNLRLSAIRASVNSFDTGTVQNISFTFTYPIF